MNDSPELICVFMNYYRRAWMSVALFLRLLFAAGLLLGGGRRREIKETTECSFARHVSFLINESRDRFISRYFHPLPDSVPPTAEQHATRTRIELSAT